MALLREPLVHFLLLGAALFALWSAAGGRAAREPDEIVVTRARIESLAQGFARTWHRRPTRQELDGLVEDYVREEIAVREALVLGLDQDDGVVRRRLRQKFEFVAEDVAAQVEPSDEELRDHLGAHPDAFRTDDAFSFRQVYLDPQRRAEDGGAGAVSLLARLRAAGPDADLSGAGDPTLLEVAFEAAPRREIAARFGEGFAAALDGLPLGEWSGPVESGVGRHLVLVRERRPGRLPALDEVREAVRRDWADAARLAASEALYRGLRERYRVEIEGEPGPGSEPVAASAR